MPSIKPESRTLDDLGSMPLTWHFTVSEGGVHQNPNVCWLVFSQLRAGHQRRGGSVDPVDHDRLRRVAGADRRVGLLPLLRISWWSRTGGQARSRR